MFQISADISALTDEQRKAVSAFILSFPSRNIHTSSIIEDEESVTIPAFSVSEDEGEPTPEEAFSVISNVSSGPQLVPVPPSTPVAPNSAPVVGANLDSIGLPWDDRIHSSSRAKNADGSWRRKRGVDETFAVKVESELKALMGIPAPPAVAAVVPVPPVPAPVADTPAAAVAVPPVQNYMDLISKATTLIGANKLTQDELNSAVVAVGVPTLALLANRLDLVPQVISILDGMTLGR